MSSLIWPIPSNPPWSKMEISGKEYQVRPYRGRKTDAYGNNRACDCKDLMEVNTFCVCIARCWCPKHGGPRCVGGHD